MAPKKRQPEWIPIFFWSSDEVSNIKNEQEEVNQME